MNKDATVKQKFDVPVQVLLTRRQVEAMQAAAARSEISQSEYVRQAIREKIARETK